MEFIILGLLHFSPLTGYEIGNFIKNNLALICSSSAGSVQSALKKLILSESIVFEQSVENGKNKKRFFITDKGKQEFQAWIQNPMQIDKVKNMELSKLFFLGFAEEEKRKEAIKNYIEQLRQVRDSLCFIQKTVKEMDRSNLREVKVTDLESIMTFQNYTLKYGIDSTEFEMNWYEQLLKEMEI